LPSLAELKAAERAAFAAIGALGERELSAVKAWIASGCERAQPKPDDEARRLLADQLTLATDATKAARAAPERKAV
jgi:hypothetical protein